MTNALATTNGADLAEQVAIAGDLAKLTPEQRMSYYGEVCRSMGLNPLTRPFEYIVLNDKLTLYARRDATDQLRKIHGVNISIVARETVEGVYVVTARATTNEGRSDESVGAVALVKEGGEWRTSQNNKRYFQGDGTYKPLGPEDRANAMMKAETKAKRRVTLSVVGLGWLDETEIETVPSARRVLVNDSGEINGSASYDPPAITPIPATDKQRRYIGGLQNDLGWHSEYMAQFAKEHKIDLVAMTAADAGYMIDQMKAALDEPSKAAKELKPSPPSPPADPLPGGVEELAASVKKLRECERAVTEEPPPFTWNRKQGRAALQLEHDNSRMRIYAWLVDKGVGNGDGVILPDLSELDDAGLMDLAYAAAGL